MRFSWDDLLGVLEVFVLASLDDAMQASAPPVLVDQFSLNVRYGGG
jgi:hypothetical protein